MEQLIFSGRDEESMTVTVVLRPDFTYTVIEGASLLQERARTDRRSSTSTKTSASPSAKSDPLNRTSPTAEDNTCREHNI